MLTSLKSTAAKLAALAAVATILALATVAACTPGLAPTHVTEPIFNPTVESTATPTNTLTVEPSPTPTVVVTISGAWQSPTPGPSPTPLPDPDLEAGGLIQLTQTRDTEEDPVWSPDGEKIAFGCYSDGWVWSRLGPNSYPRNHIRPVRNWRVSSYDYPPSAICVMNADGSGRKELTNFEADAFDPAWSPDSSKIAFSSRPDLNRDIYVMNADGSDARPIIVDMFNSLRPAWSPDGSQITFSSYVVSGDDSHVYVVDADGSNLTRVSNGPGSHSDPSWSPDGNRIAYYSRIGEDSSLHIVNAYGSVRTLLDEARPLVNQVEWVTTPEWSPDGGRIAFAAGVRPSDSGPYYAEIHTINIDGSGLIRLTGRNGADWQPSWNPDGNKLAFTSEPILGHSEICITPYR